MCDSVFSEIKEKKKNVHTHTHTFLLQIDSLGELKKCLQYLNWMLGL